MDLAWTCPACLLDRQFPEKKIYIYEEFSRVRVIGCPSHTLMLCWFRPCVGNPSIVTGYQIMKISHYNNLHTFKSKKAMFLSIEMSLSSGAYFKEGFLTSEKSSNILSGN